MREGLEVNLTKAANKGNHGNRKHLNTMQTAPAPAPHTHAHTTHTHHIVVEHPLLLIDGEPSRLPSFESIGPLE